MDTYLQPFHPSLKRVYHIQSSYIANRMKRVKKRKKISIVVIWFGSDAETNEFLPIVSIYKLSMAFFSGEKKKSSHDGKTESASMSKYTGMFYIYNVWYVYVCALLALELPIPDTMLNTDTHRVPPYSLWALSIRCSFDVLSGYIIKVKICATFTPLNVRP